jgi:cytohesin
VRLLLAAGADPGERDDGAETPLHRAGSAEVVRALLAAGADRDALDRFGADPLESSLAGPCCGRTCPPDRFEVAKALLAAGADRDRIDHSGKSRLASAAFRQQAEAVAFLLSLGADANTLDSGGGNPLHSIAWQGEYQDDATNDACRRIIESLAAAGAALDQPDEAGWTPLHQAVDGDWGNPTAVRALLAAGADPNVVNLEGDAPLHLAVRRGERACVEALLSAGADAKGKNHAGETPRSLARALVKERRETVKVGPVDLRSIVPDLPPDYPVPSLEETAARDRAALADAEAIERLLR